MFRALMALLAVGLLGGCSSYYDIDFAPRPAVSEVRPSGSQQPAVTGLASVIGVHREDHDLHIPESVEIRLRLENNGQETLTFDPHSMDLTGADLQPFGPPIVRAPNVTLNAMQATTLTAFFPLPPRTETGDLDFLTLRWTIQVGAQQMSQTVNFHRVFHRVYYYDEPYWDPHPHFWSGGVVVVHRRW